MYAVVQKSHSIIYAAKDPHQCQVLYNHVIWCYTAPVIMLCNNTVMYVAVWYTYDQAYSSTAHALNIVVQHVYTAAELYSSNKCNAAQVA